MPMLDQVSENLLIILRLISLEVILYTVHVLYIDELLSADRHHQKLILVSAYLTLTCCS